MPKNKEILARTRRPDVRSGPGCFLARLMTHALVGVRLVPSRPSSLQREKAGLHARPFLNDAPIQLLFLFLLYFL